MFAHHNPELTLDDLTDWCAAYIDVQQLQVQDVGIGHALWWAIERTVHVGPYHNDPAELEELWHFILAVLERQPPEKVLDILAAAPLEDLLEYAPTSFLSRAEIEAHRNPYFRGLTITGWTCTDFPGWLAFTLTDASGVLHHFEDKASVLLADQPTQFPLAASVLCQVLQHSDNGQCTLEVHTSPWGIASEQDVHSFWVHASQVLDDALE